MKDRPKLPNSEHVPAAIPETNPFERPSSVNEQVRQIATILRSRMKAEPLESIQQDIERLPIGIREAVLQDDGVRKAALTFAKSLLKKHFYKQFSQARTTFDLSAEETDSLVIGQLENDLESFSNKYDILEGALRSNVFSPELLRSKELTHAATYAINDLLEQATSQSLHMAKTFINAFGIDKKIFEKGGAARDSAIRWLAKSIKEESLNHATRSWLALGMPADLFEEEAPFDALTNRLKEWIISGRYPDSYYKLVHTYKIDTNMDALKEAAMQAYSAKTRDGDADTARSIAMLYHLDPEEMRERDEDAFRQNLLRQDIVSALNILKSSVNRIRYDQLEEFTRSTVIRVLGQALLTKDADIARELIITLRIPDEDKKVLLAPAARSAIEHDDLSILEGASYGAATEEVQTTALINTLLHMSWEGKVDNIADLLLSRNLSKDQKHKLFVHVAEQSLLASLKPQDTYEFLARFGNVNKEDRFRFIKEAFLNISPLMKDVGQMLHPLDTWGITKDFSQDPEIQERMLNDFTEQHHYGHRNLPLPETFFQDPRYLEHCRKEMYETLFHPFSSGEVGVLEKGWITQLLPDENLRLQMVMEVCEDALRRDHSASEVLNTLTAMDVSENLLRSSKLRSSLIHALLEQYRLDDTMSQYDRHYSDENVIEALVKAIPLLNLNAEEWGEHLKMLDNEKEKERRKRLFETASILPGLEAGKFYELQKKNLPDIDLNNPRMKRAVTDGVLTLMGKDERFIDEARDMVKYFDLHQGDIWDVYVKKENMPSENFKTNLDLIFSEIVM